MRSLTPIEHQLLRLAEPAAEALGLRIVRVRLQGARRVRLQIMAERVRDGLMGVEDCARLSRDLSALFDVEEPVRGEYVLEVSSPGIDRPLTSFPDFVRWAGHEARIEIRAMVDGRKRFSGVLGVPGDVAGDGGGAGGGRVSIIAADGVEYVFDFHDVQEARLVLTERLIAEDLRRAADAAALESDPEMAAHQPIAAAGPAGSARRAGPAGPAKPKGRASKRKAAQKGKAGPKNKAGIGPHAADTAILAADPETP